MDCGSAAPIIRILNIYHLPKGLIMISPFIFGHQSMQFPNISHHKIPALTTDQMREVDRLMIEEMGIQLIQMMENAGRNLARLAQYKYLQKDKESDIIVLAGKGGNGGGTLVCARHLANWRYPVKIVLSKPEDEYTGIPLL